MATNYKYCGLNILLMFLLIISILTIIVELSIKPSLLQLLFNSTSSDGNNRLQLNDSAERFYGEFSIITTTGSKEANHFKQSNRDRNLRELSNQTKNSNESNYYYEEQMPVVVYAKTDDNGSGSDSDDRSDVGGVYKDNQYYEYDYPFNKELETSQYYDSTDAERDYYDSSPVGRANANANAVWDDKINTAVTTAVDAVSGRSFHDNNYNAYYHQWHYATPSTPLHTPPAPGAPAVVYDGKLSALGDSSITENNRKPPYSPYIDDNYYDYLRHPFESSSTLTTTDLKTYHNKPQEAQEMPLLSVLRTLKILWDLYQSLVAAWNSMAIPKPPPSPTAPLIKRKLLENSTRIRINSKKPGNSIKIKSNKIFNGKNKNSILNKTKLEPLPKVEPRYSRKDVAEDDGEREIWRNSRQVKGNYDDSIHSVEQSRYIKGDPLKGYYDFVITEGSYKFWAVFQVGTAILIIYSTFAAIYYSKVNPLTSDYDYNDYLGAGRSLSTDNLDFVDDNAEGNNEKSTTLQSWYNWLQPVPVHAIKLLLNAIDKLSLDADGNEYDENEISESDRKKNMKRQVLNMK